MENIEKMIDFLMWMIGIGFGLSFTIMGIIWKKVKDIQKDITDLKIKIAVIENRVANLEIRSNNIENICRDRSYCSFGTEKNFKKVD